MHGQELFFFVVSLKDFTHFKGVIMVKKLLVLGLGLHLVLSVNAMDSEERLKEEWKRIKTAVFEKMGKDYRKQFETQYPHRSDDAIKLLARAFDDSWYASEGIQYWEGIPSKMVVNINNAEYGIASKTLENLILETREKVRKEKGLN